MSGIIKLDNFVFLINLVVVTRGRKIQGKIIETILFMGQPTIRVMELLPISSRQPAKRTRCFNYKNELNKIEKNE